MGVPGCTHREIILMEKLSLSGYTIYLRLLAMEGFYGIRPGYNCFISMTISVESLCGFLAFTLTNSLSRCFLFVFNGIARYESQGV